MGTHPPSCPLQPQLSPSRVVGSQVGSAHPTLPLHARPPAFPLPQTHHRSRLLTVVRFVQVLRFCRQVLRIALYDRLGSMTAAVLPSMSWTGDNNNGPSDRPAYSSIQLSAGNFQPWDPWPPTNGRGAGTIPLPGAMSSSASKVPRAVVCHSGTLPPRLLQIAKFRGIAAAWTQATPPILTTSAENPNSKPLVIQGN
jgi:hypothetical protein